MYQPLSLGLEALAGNAFVAYWHFIVENLGFEEVTFYSIKATCDHNFVVVFLMQATLALTNIAHN